MFGVSMLVAWGLQLPAGESEGPAANVEFHLHYEPEPAPGRLELSVEARGLDRGERDVVAVLSDWGEWTQVPGYLRDRRAEPPLAASASADRMCFELPPSWDGSLRLRYTIDLQEHGSERQRRHGLLPWRLEGLGMAFAHNVLPVIHQGGRPVEARRRIRLSAPDELSIASGWLGLSRGRQEIERRQPVDQCMLLFGEPLAVLRSDEEGLAIEVVQYGPVEDITPTLMDMMRRLIPSYVESTSHRLDKTFRAFVTGIDPHGGGGIRTDHGIGVSYTAEPSSPYYLHTIAHETFHEWLPGALPPLQAKVVWFFEGFTDYLSLWHLVGCGVVSPDWFLSRIQELDADARASPRFGKVRYADPSLSWRDGDGPMETLAYKGGALLAFHLDAALYREGGPPVVRLIADLIEERGGYSLPALREWCEAQGVESWFDRFVAAGEPLPRPREWAEELGYVSATVDVPMTYFGVRLAGKGRRGEVVAIDPEGPTGTRANLRVGDIVLSSGPRRTDGARLKEGVSVGHPFGLTDFELQPGGGGWWLEIERDGERRRVEIEAWWSDGAEGPRWVAPADERMEFFERDR